MTEDKHNTQTFFETASFHIVKPCNMQCKFCYATFDDMHITKQLSKESTFRILDRLKEAGLQKITFAGGEPLLYKHIHESIIYSKEIGLTTSIITNGSLLTDSLLTKFESKLDWLGISIDSLNDKTNVSIGRNYKGKLNYNELVDRIKSHGFKLKINTVVNRYNENENMQDFITRADPLRWKIFDTLRVEGQNDKQYDEIKTSEFGFKQFVDRHNHSSMVVEDNASMTGSYLLIDPQGRLFENSKGCHTYSSPLQDNNIDNCLSEINLNRDMFIKRGGIYEW